MKKKATFSIRGRLKSFVNALVGIRTVVKEEDNAKIHLGIGLVLYVLTAILKLKKLEIAAILFSIGFVVVAEIFNTVIENLCDFIHPGKHTHIKKIKNISAAAVLISAITAFIIGLIIFLPTLIHSCTN
ncbi:diacylglycerol kinase family protein [Marinifilum caeruleilacunae]|uniref:Diacylglycerol kinase family protein n=1 Tax=Marinifilum caeruleilacunae TaxID=2499076 RepID=A0ABX1WXA5_9BACT|nr:diacylglycerol kinase family protein [Marinifilum caeruleilacunae]NOU60746.1 diacylglycerol kinase family protein [Marinifilum caeruleilacunae]